ncbi:MAG TPA: hypothetical protein VLO13_04630 [Halomonas sp.]|nr:hypothetical protein [Halomonas sp.]
MRKPQSVDALEKLGMVRLSPSFYMRDFLYSETANLHGIPNIPDNPDLAIEGGRSLCEELLEPLNATFGRIAVRSSYRSSELNKFCNEHGYNCAKNEANYAAHIWDVLDSGGHKGATACIAIPWFTDRYEKGADWRSLAYWIHDHLPYSELQFFPALCAFNINWHEMPKKSISSFIAPKGALLKESHSQSGHSALYADFPALCRFECLL